MSDGSTPESTSESTSIVSECEPDRDPERREKEKEHEEKIEAIERGEKHDTTVSVVVKSNGPTVEVSNKPMVLSPKSPELLPILKDKPSTSSSSSSSGKVRFARQCYIDPISPAKGPVYKKPSPAESLNLRRAAYCTRLYAEKIGEDVPDEIMKLTPPAIKADLDKVMEEEKQRKKTRKKLMRENSESRGSSWRSLGFRGKFSFSNLIKLKKG